MRALCWHGQGDVRVDTVAEPTIVEPTDAIIKITSTAICGSDLHLLDGYQPTMEAGDIMGHEPIGIVIEVGSAVTKLKKGDRVVVPFVIACGTFLLPKDPHLPVRHDQSQRQDRRKSEGALPGRSRSDRPSTPCRRGR